MLFSITDYIDPEVVIASLAGAMVYILTQRHFNRGKQPFIFFISFVMGIVGADTTLKLVNEFIHSDLIVERSAGAFLCSALVVTIIIKIIAGFEKFFFIKKKS